jgi:hypothetical protein
MLPIRKEILSNYRNGRIEIKNFKQKKPLLLTLLKEKFGVCQLNPTRDAPDWSINPYFQSITRTPDELSVVCLENDIPSPIKAVKDWRCFKVKGPLDFSQTGILSSLTQPLAENNIPVFVISTYNTDYLFVKNADINECINLLKSKDFELLI